MPLNFIRLADFKLSILSHFTVEIFETLLVVRRNDAKNTKKPPPGGAARAFWLAVAQKRGKWQPISGRMLAQKPVAKEVQYSVVKDTNVQYSCWFSVMAGTFASIVTTA